MHGCKQHYRNSGQEHDGRNPAAVFVARDTRPATTGHQAGTACPAKAIACNDFGLA